MKVIATTAERINEALRLRGMRPYELCQKTKISSSNVSRYLKGTYAPKQDNIYKMAVALNVNPAWLIGFDVDMEVVDPSKDKIYDEIEALLKNMNKAETEKTLDFIKEYILK